MGMTVWQLENSMSAGELARWMAFDRLSPVGGERLDYLIARMMFFYAAANRNPKKPFNFSLEDFLPHWGKTESEIRRERFLSPDQVVRRIEALNAALGGEDRRKQ